MGLRDILSQRKSLSSAAELTKAAKAAKADVVSVDLFDTLVYRAIVEPNDVFRLQSRRLPAGKPWSAPGVWFELRKRVEENLARAAWPREINLDDIYETIGVELDLPEVEWRALRDSELEIEQEVIRPYDDLLVELGALQAGGGQIVVLTDTYLPEDFLRRVLSRFVTFEHRLLCSSTTGFTKRSGSAFVDLRSRFAGRRLIHFGDNLHSDVRMAGRHGVQARGVRWRRQRELADSGFRRRACAIGVARMVTPWDAQTSSALDPVDRIAWRWSVVLADFVGEVREYSQKIGATDIWFLSRDCETIFKALSAVPEIFGRRRIRYVHASRACVYPLLAEGDPARFRKWRGRDAAAADVAAGRLAREYYRSMLVESNSRVLIVDIGWKGRLQEAFSGVLGDSAVFYGYYFSLEKEAEPTTLARSQVFVEWDRSVFNQAVVEALSGYSTSSAVGFRNSNTGIEPTFSQDLRDRSPQYYCDRLRHYLATMLKFGPVQKSPDFMAARREAIREICLFPDLRTVEAFKEWSIATTIDGSDTAPLPSGGRSSLLDRSLGRAQSGNIWPAGSMWTVTRSPFIVMFLQTLHWIRLTAKRLTIKDGMRSFLAGF